jgi:hypothetical protein
MKEVFLLKFAPDQWTPFERFRAFASDTYPDPWVADGLTAIQDHLSKYEVIAGLVNDLIPTIDEDRKELEEMGYSSSRRSRQIAALCEVLVCELYSSLDGLRDTLFGIYRHVKGIQRTSNEILFRRAKERKYGDEFPDSLRNVLSDAFDAWFRDLKKLRTEVTHGQVGYCHLDKETKEITYHNLGLGDGNKALVIADFITHVSRFFKEIRILMDVIFSFLYRTLKPIPRLQICGIFKARWYGRMVAPKEGLSFSDGNCVSWDWFESLEGHRCPLSSKCGAYARKQKVNF